MISNWRKNNRLGHVWREFTDGNCKRYHIKHLKKNMREKCTELILNVILTNDPISIALGIPGDPVSINYLQNLIERYLSQDIAYGCFLKRDNQEPVLVGVDVLYVRTFRDEFPNTNEIQGEPFKNFLKYLLILERYISYTTAEGAFKYLTSFGIFIIPEYRNEDVEKNIITIRKSIATALRMDIIASVFVGRSLQLAAKANNYRVFQEFDQRIMLKCGLRFNSVDVFPIRIMGIKFKNRIKPPFISEEHEDDEDADACVEL